MSRNHLKVVLLYIADEGAVALECKGLLYFSNDFCGAQGKRFKRGLTHQQALVTGA